MRLRAAAGRGCGRGQGFYQEAGRAGRDGGAARCVLMYDPRDIRRFHTFMRKKTKAQKKRMLEDLERVPPPASFQLSRRHLCHLGWC